MAANDPVLTVAEMQAAERALMEAGISEYELMQRAGQGAADWIRRIAVGCAVTVLCGPGNNGGDGYVIAESLRRSGLGVAVIAPLAPKTDTAREAREDFSGAVESHGEGTGSILVDCLFGTGQNRPVEGDLGETLARLRASHRQLVAVDLPSNVAADSADLLGPVPRHHMTIALGAWKRAHWTMPAAPLMGERRLVDIGVEPADDAARLLAPPRLSSPAADAHKYTRGMLGIVAGEMPGATLLAADAALRAGAGYVKLLAETRPDAVPHELVVDTYPLDDALTDERFDALLLGPGLGRGDEAQARLKACLDRDLPIVLDADALTLLTPATLEGRTKPVLATPHEGELARLCEAFGVEEKHKAERALALAKASGMVVMAKGADTVIAAPDGRLGFCPSASGWLSAAGTGDVLAGIAASRLATGAEPFAAASEAFHIHACAARLCGPAFTSGELAHRTGAAYRALL